MRNTGFNRYFYDFSVDYNVTAVDDILDIHNYVMKKNDIVQQNAFIKRCFFIQD